MSTNEQAPDLNDHLKQATGRVVVGVDGSPRSLEALGIAAEIARWRGLRLDVVVAWHVVYPVSPYGIGFDELISAARDTAEIVLRDAVKEVLGDEPGVEVVGTVEQGSAASVLVRASQGADLLVVGSRGHGGFSSLALGSVGQACVHHAHCPVLIIRPKTHEVIE
ncbi:MAG: universal stress protein [Acidimicrobiales bacterium]